MNLMPFGKNCRLGERCSQRWPFRMHLCEISETLFFRYVKKTVQYGGFENRRIFVFMGQLVAKLAQHAPFPDAGNGAEPLQTLQFLGEHGLFRKRNQLE